MKNKLLKYYAWLLVLISIFFFALIDTARWIPFTTALNDTYRHILAFAVLVGLTRFTFHKLSLIQIIVLTFIFGCAIEFAQEIFTGGLRKFHVKDLLNNIIGMGIGIIGILFYNIKKNRKHLNSWLLSKRSI